MEGLFVTFEGTEGSGKSTQIQLLSETLLAKGRQVLSIREPGGTRLGEEIRHLLKHSEAGKGMFAETELLLMNASRAQLVREVICPALRENKIVLCDRFYDSTIAYQLFGRGLDEGMVRRVIECAVAGTEPDLTILLRVPLEVSESRRVSRSGEKSDRFEGENREFFRRVEEGYDTIAASGGSRVRSIDASRSVQEVQDEIWRWVEQLLSVPSAQGERAWKTVGEYRMAAPGSD